ncbi:transcription elongation factor-like protein SPT4 [Protomyces lactucae-debilis]|uniref:Transcription elongation factor SPT4 n=1 Tax=Protomyces lactucae-debilis TaxID=2754530 RepID=A0A1Y2FGB8_PROLT|nr:transcription elongation factor-like protein SPT4 [Protomyces lactucae-debilis]ORY82667.1 transcription elongation factor-like protein SPT4 [Protomyces lactucae-debilis]
MSRPAHQDRALPTSSRNLRACLLCAILLTDRQFSDEGCPNCESILRTTERPEQTTSAHHEGRIAMMQPTASWVARWTRVDKFVAGLYAAKVQGVLDDEVVEELESMGIKYRPRDGSQVD